MTSTPLACESQDLSVVYRDEPVLRHVNFRVPTGSVMGIVGPNGAGKSTLIKAMLGLVKPLTGHATFFGQPFGDVRKRVGYMPQSASVDWDFPTTVIDLAVMGTYGELGWIRRPGKAERARAMAALEMTGMQDFASRQIGELSGGQRQRAFLARALVQAPDLYFMDEPFQGIDAKSQQAMIEVLKDLSAQGKTIVIVHHHLASVLDFCDHVTLLNKRIIASGPGPETFTKDNIRMAYEASDGAEAFLAEAG
ncbi:metal ABC transporter ATP-binding protein [Cognatishimia activa]|uniref:Putative zinc transport system ATP-binding protein AdcC n=1 Tax=Cognatishimia activa TaxID=1715691 RepID=A0A0P1IUQ2_9RHOB|nr:ABC transporter ATP-binding protein [Cognatishimia activa]MEE2946223.1 ABC transporter ATP-binding protein [Pseudomonadota bacterium]CUJ29840.1 putative zinc transport system ATP-binding protein AdcC [Cognatishimia activa]CUK27222.1 putative zinc transport system ATP-binding protein AdcC [Cognatishimia activa]